ncbi:hypothetical protein PG985_009930 [Apiospora marii]|uniref:uncharacterized protein n=1 Tax=Apiospora marii TaxID=335849 RepID=UPI00312CC76C
MAYVPQQPLWIPDPTYVTFPKWKPTPLTKIIRPNTCPCPTCESLRARGQPEVYQYVDGRGEPHNPPELTNRLRDGPRGPRSPWRPATLPRFRPEERKDIRFRDVRSRRRVDLLANALLSATIATQEALTSSEQLASKMRVLRDMLTKMSDVLHDLAQDYEDGQDDKDDKGYDDEIASVVRGPDCHRHDAGVSSNSSSGSGSGSGSSSNSDSADPADPWGPEGWDSDKGKEKEVLQQEPEEELIMPTLFNKKGPEHKEKEPSMSKSESESPQSEALSGSASREF